MLMTLMIVIWNEGYSDDPFLDFGCFGSFLCLERYEDGVRRLGIQSFDTIRHCYNIHQDPNLDCKF